MATPLSREIDITGQTFGRLTAVQKVSKTGKARWLCRCECGNETIVRLNNLRRKAGGTNSCGCLQRDVAASLRRENPKHGYYGTPTYISWQSMKRRCRTKHGNDWKLYAARGITFCQRWNDFSAFLADMGERPSLDYSIDRIDNDGNYEPGNCRWATHEEQVNNRRNTPIVPPDYSGPVCRVSDCDRPVRCRDLCGRHYDRLLKGKAA